MLIFGHGRQQYGQRFETAASAIFRSRALAARKDSQCQLQRLMELTFTMMNTVPVSSLS
jgi:hypothetical protein